MPDNRSDIGVPRPVLIAAAGLIALTIAGAAAARVGVFGADDAPPAKPLATVELRFEDRPDGGVAVFEVEADRMVALLEPGTNGFVRGVLRGLVRERRRHDVLDRSPFHLSRWQDGGLSLTDPSTGEHVFLNAFGVTNLAAFARFLPQEDTAR